MRKVYRTLGSMTLRPAVGAIVKLWSKVIDDRSRLPIFFFFLMVHNTQALQTIHVLQNIQVKTGRRIVVVTRWPFWSAETQWDQFFASFMQGLTPKVHYIWIPAWLEFVVHRFVTLAARLALRYDELHWPAGLNSTIRFRAPSTIEHTDILNQGRRVPFQIPESHHQVLESHLIALGIPSDAWFVCVHAREHGWVAQAVTEYGLKNPPDYRHEQEEHRNVDIKDYFPAIEYIKSLGGMVVRMGDPSMTPISGIDGVIDYPFTEYRSMPMDLYLVSKCRFVLGCNSGFSGTFPRCFDTPVLITNYTAPSTTAFWPYSNNMLLFMHAVEQTSGRVISPREMCHPSRYAMNADMDDTVRFGSLGYRWQPNTPEEILDAVKEMNELVETGSFDRPRTPEQELFHQYRLGIIDSLWSAAEQKGDSKYSQARCTESRISATFAARYFDTGQLQTAHTEVSRKRPSLSKAGQLDRKRGSI